jgi:hypothetical protein
MLGTQSKVRVDLELAVVFLAIAVAYSSLLGALIAQSHVSSRTSAQQRSAPPIPTPEPPMRRLTPVESAGHCSGIAPSSQVEHGEQLRQRTDDHVPLLEPGRRLSRPGSS